MDIEKLQSEVTEIAVQTGKMIRKDRKSLRLSDISAKGTHDYVTKVDKKSEEILVKSLTKLFPGAGFLTEEKTIRQDRKEYTWIIDPLDGTTNFMHGVPPFAVSIALTRNDRIILGIIYEIIGEEIFSATVSGPATLNGIEIRVSETPTLDQALIATGFPFINFERLEPYMEVLKSYMVKTQGVRRLGSAATDLAYVACGRYDAFYEYNLNPWDVAAGALIVERAGGKVSDFSAGENYLYGKELVATNGRIHKEFMEPINKHLTP